MKTMKIAKVRKMGMNKRNKKMIIWMRQKMMILKIMKK
jgi:hypothetical protein